MKPFKSDSKRILRSVAYCILSINMVEGLGIQIIHGISFND